jgi:hypothetical protein
MANALYDKARESFLKGEINWATNDIKAVLVDLADYTLNIATHQYLSDVPAPARVATSANFAGKTTAAGVSDADNVTWPSVTGDPSEALIIYQDTGSAGTSRLIAFIDTATGLPVTPNGGDIIVAWDDGANKIYKL